MAKWDAVLQACLIGFNALNLLMASANEPQRYISSEFVSKMKMRLYITGEDIVRFLAVNPAENDGSFIGINDPIPSFGNQTPLIALLQCYSYSPEAAKVLIGVPGINLEATDPTNNNQTALHIACYKEGLELVKALVYAKAELNAIEYFTGYTPIHVAAYKGNLEIVKFLASQEKTDCTIKNARRGTLLHTACEGSYSHVASLIHFLISELKLDITEKDIEGRDAFQAGVVVHGSKLFEKKPYHLSRVTRNMVLE